MSLYINTNTNSIYAQFLFSLLNPGTQNQSNSSPADIALSQSEQQGAMAYEQWGNNATQGISLAQTAAGGLEEIMNILQQMNVLSTEGASGTLSSSELGNLQTQYSLLQSEVNNIAGTTEFNGTSLLQNSNGSVSIQVSPTSSVTIPLPKADTTSLGIASTDVSTASDAASAMTSITNAMNTVSSSLAQLGGSEVTLQNSSLVDANMASNMTMASSSSLTSSLDYALISSQASVNSALVQADIAMLAQANATSKNVLQLLFPTGLL